MPLHPDDLETAALELPSRERARLAHRLIENLDAGTDISTDVKRAWDAEIERRVAAFRAGEMDAIPASEVFAEARSLVEER